MATKHETKLFPTNSVQLRPCKLSDNKIIYCTRYEQSNRTTGIFEYDINSSKNKLIKSWKSMKHFPRWNSMIYSKIHNTFYSVGGNNVKQDHNEYLIIMTFNLTTNKSTEIPVNIKIGRNSQLLLTDNDNVLHIIAGQASTKHIVFNLNTKQYDTIHDFAETNPEIQQVGAIYNTKSQAIYMLGGCGKSGAFSDFWICDRKIDQIEMKKIIHSWTKLVFNRADHIPSEIVNLMLSFNGYNQWYIKEAYRLPTTIHSFGAVLYDDRIVIIFGGFFQPDSYNFIRQSKVYYLDITDEKGWVESEFELRNASSHSALLMDEDTVHILPFYDSQQYLIVKGQDVLPESLLRNSQSWF